MASVRKCPGCKTCYPLDVSHCSTCNVSLSAEEVIEASGEQSSADAKVRCGAAGCGQMNDAGATHCVYCNTLLIPSRGRIEADAAPSAHESADVSAGGCRAVIALLFPWGAVCVEHQLFIGRNPAFSSVARELAKYDNVSGRHAQLWVENGIVYVTDVGSTNGTFVNGTAIPKGKAVTLKAGDQIRFAATVTAILQVGE